MADYPYMPLWTDAYLADTRHLTTRQHGAYMLLLMEAWRRPSCSLPGDDAMLARLAGLSSDEWEEDRDVVMAPWSFDGRRKEWQQKRQVLEREKSASKRQVARDKAVKRWDKKKNDDAAALQKPCTEDANQNQNHKKKEEPKGSSKNGTRLSPDWVLTKPFGQAAVEIGLSPDEARKQGDVFRDYWIGVAGAKGVKRDWLATWRNWCRKFDRDRKQGKPFGGSPAPEGYRWFNGELIKAQGPKPKGATHENRKPDTVRAACDAETGAVCGQSPDALPTVQPHEEEEERWVSFSDDRAGRTGSDALSPLSMGVH